MVVEKGDALSLSKGYKQTEVGIIPIDWNIEDIGNISDVYSGGTPNTEVRYYYGGSINFLSSGDLNQIRITKASNTITNEGFENSSAKIVLPGTLLIAMYGATAGVCAITNIEGAINQAILAVISERQEPEYIFYWWQLNKNKLVNKLTQGGQPNLSGNIIKSIALPLPPLPEQTAIANALSDMDALIAQTEKLIEKKKAIKQGVMQELLKPKEGWVTVKIREIAKVGRGRVISQNEIAKSINKSYPVYSSQTSNNGVMGYIDTYDFEGEYITWTTDGEKAGTVFHRKGRFNCTNVCGTIKLKDGNPRFIHYVLAIEAPKHVSRNLANPKLMNEPMKNIEIVIPENIDVQNFISDTIFDMEMDINVIETKLQKLKLQKQGMMQALLTGKIRLI